MNAAELIHVEDLVVRRGAFTLELPRWQVAPGSVVGARRPQRRGQDHPAGVPGRPASHRTAGRSGSSDLDPWRDPVRVRSALGFMSDSMPLFAMKIGALLRMLSGYYPTWDGPLVDELLDRFKLDPGKRVGQLSRGQGTRLRLVTAMAFRPRLLLLDEPAAGLDLGGRRALLDSVLEVVRDPERSVIISSHMLVDVERIADRLLVINDGQAIQEGPTGELVGEERTLEEALLAWGAAG